jgi:hypothetical protein
MDACSKFIMRNGQINAISEDSVGQKSLVDCLNAIVQANKDVFIADNYTHMNLTANSTTSSVTDDHDYQGPMVYVVVVLMVYSLSILAFMASMIHKTHREEECVDDYLKGKHNLPKEWRLLQTNRTQNFLLKRQMKELLKNKMGLDLSSSSLNIYDSEHSSPSSSRQSLSRSTGQDTLHLSIPSKVQTARRSSHVDIPTTVVWLPVPTVTVTGTEETTFTSDCFQDVTLV